MADDQGRDEQPSGAFGNAVQIAHRKGQRQPARRSSHVLRCPGCGAPRERADLSCRYCGGKTTE
jgi:rRNA maturation endonuclease Nob1